MINTQLTGEHAFGEYRDVQVDWRAGHSRASRGAPYEKGFRYREDAYGFWAHDASQAQNYTRFSQVDERVDNAGVAGSSEKRREGKAGVRQVRSRRSPYPKKK